MYVKKVFRLPIDHFKEEKTFVLIEQNDVFYYGSKNYELLSAR